MNCKDFKELLNKDEQIESAERRFELILDYDFKVWYDNELETYWYHLPENDTFFEVVWVGHLSYKNDKYEPDKGLYHYKSENENWSRFVKCICCGVEKNGRDILWFDKVKDKNGGKKDEA